MDVSNIFYVKNLQTSEFVGSTRAEMVVEASIVGKSNVNEEYRPGTPVLVIPLSGDKTLGKEGILLDLVKIVISDLQGIKDILKDMNAKDNNDRVGS